MKITFETEIDLDVKVEHVQTDKGDYHTPSDYETRIVSVSCPDIPSLTEDEIYKIVPYDEIREKL